MGESQKQETLPKPTNRKKMPEPPGKQKNAEDPQANIQFPGNQPVPEGSMRMQYNYGAGERMNASRAIFDFPKAGGSSLTFAGPIFPKYGSNIPQWHAASYFNPPDHPPPTKRDRSKTRNG